MNGKLDGKRDGNSKRRKHGRVRRLVIRALAIASLVYLAIIAILVANETQLVYPAPKYPTGDWSGRGLVFEEVEFSAADGTRLTSWFLPSPNRADEPRRTVLHLHGNAENAPMATRYLGDRLRQELNADVLVLDYRGYGKSGGTPDEPGLLADAEAALEWLNQRTGTSPEDVIVVGHSLGGGPACYLASQHRLKALVLQRTFGAMTDAAKSDYWWVPIDLLMRNRFENAKWITRSDCPLFQCHGDADDLVPIESGRRVYDACPARRKEFLVRPNGGHWDAYDDDYWESLVEFIREVESENRPR